MCAQVITGMSNSLSAAVALSIALQTGYQLCGFWRPHDSKCLALRVASAFSETTGSSSEPAPAAVELDRDDCPVCGVCEVCPEEVSCAEGVAEIGDEHIVSAVPALQGALPWVLPVTTLVIQALCCCQRARELPRRRLRALHVDRRHG